MQRPRSENAAASRYAVFVSPHGYGHAARASAVMEALYRREGARFEVFTTVPRWFFQESVPDLFHLHEVTTDVGYVQASALRADLGATARRLEAFLPFDEARVEGLAGAVRAAKCRAVLCDIAPLGVAVAEAAGLPSVVVENFTWSWLYREDAEGAPARVAAALRRAADELDRWRARATRILQTEPHCAPEPGAPLVPPISRPPRRSGAEVRAVWGLEADAPVVTVTMGGYGEAMPFLAQLRQVPDVTFLITGQRETRRDGNVVQVARHEPIFMPDLLRASDALVAKLGYGIIAEAWREGIPFAYVPRPDSPEMPALLVFARAHLTGLEVAPEAFASGSWVHRLPMLLELPRAPRPEGGAEAVAEVIVEVAEGTAPTR